MSDSFPGLPYPAERIKKYICNLDFFMFQLDNGELKAFTAENREALLLWLKKNDIPDVRDSGK